MLMRGMCAIFKPFCVEMVMGLGEWGNLCRTNANHAMVTDRQDGLNTTVY